MPKKMPKPFGFPAWKNCKWRVAKKWFKRRGRDLLERYWYFHNAAHDSLFCGCSGLNEKGKDIYPIYMKVGPKAEILVDIDLIGETCSCSFYHCGVAPPKTYEQCLAYVEEVKKRWKDNDEWGFAERYGTATIYPDGTYKMY